VSLIVTSLLVASGVILGRFLARSRQPAQKEQPEEENQTQRQQKPEEKPVVATDPLDGFACKLGDVVMRGSSEEAWLAGALVLREQTPVAALFVAPEAKQDRAVLVRPQPSEEILWLAPIDGAALGIAKEPPASIEHSGDRFERTKRLPVRSVRLGSGAPDVGDTLIFAEYGSLGGDRIVVLCGTKPTAFRGTVLESGTYTILPSGKSTLEDEAS
jgi:hypothetical protein